MFPLSLGLRLLPFLKSWKVAAGVGLVLAVLGNFWYINNLQNQRDQLTLDKIMVTRWYKECHGVNLDNQGEMLTLKRANESLSKAISISHESMLRAAEIATERELQSKLALDSTLDEMRELQNESPSCKKLSEIDIGAVCPNSVFRLREHAAGTNSSIRND